MKRKNLLILLAAIFTQLTTISATAGEKKLAIEGRTWWYKSYFMAYPKVQEFGIRIGEEVTVDGEKWNKVKLYMYDEPHHPDSISGVKTDSLTIGYIKDDGVNISTKTIIKPVNCEALADTRFFDLYLNIENSVYSFGEIGSQGFYGNQLDSFSQFYLINNITELSNSGNTFRVFHVIGQENELGFGYLTDTYEYIEGIGDPKYFMMLPFHDDYINMLRWDVPELAYVTDGDDNHVIYEAAGGKKLWELAGVEAVTVDSDNSQPEWFTLQGVKIDEPTATGVYIRRTGSRSEKVVVK